MWSRPCARFRGIHRYRQAPAAEVSGAEFATEAAWDVGTTETALEHEADAAADGAMQIPPVPVVQRERATGENEHAAQRSPLALPAKRFSAAWGSAGRRAPGSAPTRLPSSQDAGTRLEPAVKSFMERRFGADFSAVRIHTDEEASQLSRALDAEAFTAGAEIYFDRGRYDPQSASGKHLLAHELAHTVQQAAAPRSTHGTAIQRKVRVDKPKELIDNPTGKRLVQTNARTVQSYLQVLCSEGAISVDAATGLVSMKKSFCPTFLPAGTAGPRTAAASDKSKEPVGCECVCQMVDSFNDYTIVVDDTDWPHTSGNVVTAPSPNSPKLWGAATVTGKTLDIDPWLVLGHEFCGHAWLEENKLRDENATRGEGGHQETVERENQLRREHGIELRGGFKDPFCGESYWRDKSAPGKAEWSSYLAKCKAWRDRTYGGKYKLSDRIP